MRKSEERGWERANTSSHTSQRSDEGCLLMGTAVCNECTPVDTAGPGSREG
ncbi:hypothetical protein FH972_022583 [Carpinus fangiana]|uniref:Uncharacterized protein n=1 Tax=Carpinus fangiana TaxID=176857 RepID=A0A5N6KSN4_9ROSI|nr:hypothetical protein FH972_022583 [Carpinus fangiana]